MIRPKVLSQWKSLSSDFAALRATPMARNPRSAGMEACLGDSKQAVDEVGPLTHTTGFCVGRVMVVQA